MKKIIYAILISFFMCLGSVDAKTKQINIYLFHGDGCPHCTRAKEWLEPYTEKNKNIKLYEYEVWKDFDNNTKMKQAAALLDTTATGVPFIVIGERFIKGFGETTSESIKEEISYYLKNDYYDPVGEYLGVKSPSAKPGTTIVFATEDSELLDLEDVKLSATFGTRDNVDTSFEEDEGFSQDRFSISAALFFTLIGCGLCVLIVRVVNKKELLSNTNTSLKTKKTTKKVNS